MKISPFTASYGRVRALSFPGAELEPGGITAVIGANGSGKSTFAKALCGVIPTDGGTSPLPPAARVGYLPQKPYPFRMSVRANLMLGGSDPERAERLMRALDILHLADKRGSSLSGGESARMALARLMMGSFELLILDEPTAAMDMEATGLAESLIREYAAGSGAAVLLVTHSLSQARRLASSAMFFHAGEVPEMGSGVLHSPKLPETLQFLKFYGM